MDTSAASAWKVGQDPAESDGSPLEKGAEAHSPNRGQIPAAIPFSGRGESSPKHRREILCILREARAVLAGEVEALRADPRHAALPVGPGRRLPGDGRGVSYRVHCAAPMKGVRLWETVGYSMGQETRSAEVVGVHGRQITLLLEEDLGETTPEGSLERDNSWLLRALDQRLREIENEITTADRDRRFAFSTIVAAFGIDDAAEVVQCEPDVRVWQGDPLGPDQQLAVRCALGSPLHLLWGPPGTGKTLTLARIVEAHVRAGRRVLLLAGANRAVDVALQEVAARFKGDAGYGDGLLLRYGPAESVELPAPTAEDLCVSAVVHRRIHRMMEQPRQAARQVAGLRYVLGELGNRPYLDPRGILQGTTARCLSSIKTTRAIGSPADPDLIAAITDRVVGRCGVLATTIAQTFLSRRIARERWDVVVVDEASQLSAVALLSVAAIAKRLVLAGDFRQLGPVATSRGVASERWLRRDPFALLGVPDDLERGDMPPIVTMLSSQRRSAAEICGVYAPAYLDLLRTHPSVAGRDPGRYVLGPDPLLFVDTSHLEPRVERVGSSRRNLVHVEVAGALFREMIARNAVPKGGPGEVFVISPFGAQVTAHATNLRRIAGGGGTPMVGTVHAVQGEAADIVVLDLTDAPGLPISCFLQRSERYSQEGARMLTVAMSRARCHLVIVAPFRFLLSSTRCGAVTKDMLRHFLHHGRSLSPARLGIGATSGV